MESIIRHCTVLPPKEFEKAINEGDDVFLCEYEYDVRWHSFKRLSEIDNAEEVSSLDNSAYSQNVLCLLLDYSLF